MTNLNRDAVVEFIKNNKDAISVESKRLRVLANVNVLDFTPELERKILKSYAMLAMKNLMNL